jgi:hypothetical protein
VADLPEGASELCAADDWAVGGWRLATGDWRLATGGWRLAAGLDDGTSWRYDGTTQSTAELVSPSAALVVSNG